MMKEGMLHNSHSEVTPSTRIVISDSLAFELCEG